MKVLLLLTGDAILVAMQLNLEEIRAIAKMAKEKGLDQVVLESTDTDAPVCRLQLRKLQEPVATVVALEDNGQVAEPPYSDARLLLVTSPTVGIFRFIGDPPSPGQKVQDQQVIGLVESMKVPNEVRLTSGGSIETVFVEDGQGVEFGQPLLELSIDA